MRNKVFLALAVICCLILTLGVLAACNDEKGEGGQSATTGESYVIQYTDDTGTYSIDVKQGEPYSMSAIPTREGYDFIGLFDAEVGGTQYVNAKGSSLAPFSDGKNLVLFPQFKAKEFRLVLNYQGAPVTGEREIVVSYGSRIESLPTDLKLENKTFMGWYTEPERGGLQVADEYGVLPEASLISSRNFDLTDPDGFIRLYAGFRGEMHTVTFYFEAGMAPEEKEIEHGTPIASVVTDTRVDGKAAYVWSLKENDTEHSAVFNGRVEGDMVLYALEYAPVIDFNAGEGDKVTSIIAPAGSSVVLPEATRENWSFAGWYTAGGSKYTATVMPTDSVKLTAKWEPMLIFDERGGTLVEDIAAEQGTRVTLPETEKDGYIFAGWYTEQGEEYTSTSMPAYSTKLVAKYRKTVKKVYTLMAEDDDGKLSTTKPSFEYKRNYNILDLSELFNAGTRQIQLTAHYKGRYIWRSVFPDTTYIYMNYYTQQTASDGYKVWGHTDSFKKNDESFHAFSHSTSLELTSPKLYIAKFMSNYSTTGLSAAGQGEVVDFWVEVEYPDMTQLY